jgi:flagellar biosynthesis protein FlhG
MIGQAERLIELNQLRVKGKNGEKHKIIAFSSGKGGTGKTFLSLNIAYALSLRQKKILFIDLDVNLSNAHIMMNVVASKTLYDFINGGCSLKELITPSSKNLHFIFGDSGKIDYSKFSPALVENLFDQLHQMDEYDFILMDMGSGAGEEMINIISNADLNLIIISPEPTSVMDAYVILKFLKAKNYTGESAVIINKCPSKEEGLIAYNNLSAASNHFLKEKPPLLGLIEYNKAVTQSIINQSLLITQYPDSRISAEIKELSGRLIKIKTSLKAGRHLANIQQE